MVLFGDPGVLQLEEVTMVVRLSLVYRSLLVVKTKLTDPNGESLLFLLLRSKTLAYPARPDSARPLHSDCWSTERPFGFDSSVHDT